MKEVFITRFSYSPKQVLGCAITVKDPLTAELFIAKSLELEWLDNRPNISCIPKGIYSCKFTRSNRLSALAGRDIFTYEVLEVEGRSGIRIHSVNYFFDLEGCIALGAAHKDINLDGSLDTIHSGDTVRAFNALMEYKEFDLMIT